MKTDISSDKPMPPKVSKALRAQCARAASARFQKPIWALSGLLRGEALARLTAGEEESAVIEWLTAVGQTAACDPLAALT
jgi:hypothetical protein